ncbi:MAG: putative mismatch-specific glycosylase [Clostridiales bacterium]|jgi:hypoxanthine-DNA glycosylase|nr:putative mismatch-specific glycosylase [Clostridiales bacterium]
MEKLITHSFEPIYNKNSRILILGTMPSPKSRENGFYYSHPQNKFWKVIADVLGKHIAETIEDRRDFLLENKIALWDVLQSCNINGADDQSIKNPIVNDLSDILLEANIQAIFTTGTKATSLYKRYCLPETKISSIYLPSTSPANCRHYSYEDLVREYEVVLEWIGKNNKEII